ncbi:LysR family transcriptional regulator [Saccharothrix sp. AJ9571]|nr:LysR family transcriptional regulator [Saccharothrix sp. AJ9571]
MVELREVETFLEVSHELHFGRAAVRLGVSQGRVSQTIRGLERQVGGRLFERTSRRVRLTGLGRLFQARVQHGYGELVEALRECRASAREGDERIRVAYQATVGGPWLSRVASAFTADRPGCEVVFNSFVSFLPQRDARLPALLENLGADLGLVWSPGGDGTAVRDPEVTVGPVLGEEARGVLVPKDHPLARSRAVGLEDLRGYELLRLPDAVDSGLRDQWTPRFTHAGNELRHTSADLCQLTGREDVPYDDVLSLVALGRGLHLTIATLLDRLPFSDLVVVPVHDLPPAVVVPVWLNSRETATTREFARVSEAVMAGAWSSTS